MQFLYGVVNTIFGAASRAAFQLKSRLFLGLPGHGGFAWLLLFPDPGNAGARETNKNVPGLGDEAQAWHSLSPAQAASHTIENAMKMNLINRVS
jgi:hypothetical protein